MVHLWTMNGSMADGQLPLSIAYKRLFLVVLAAHVWGPRWSCRRILFHVDNKAVVHILNSQTSKDPKIMHLLRSLLKVAACLTFTFAAVHVVGKTNGIADALSRFNLQGFCSLSSTVCQEVSSPHLSTAFSSAFQWSRSSLPLLHVLILSCFKWPYLLLCSANVHTLLCRDWSCQLLQLSMSSHWMDPVSFCHVLGWFLAALFY